MFKKYIARLTDEKLSICKGTVKRLSGPSQKARRGRILLHTDADGPDPWTDWTGPRRWRPCWKAVQALRARHAGGR